MHFKKGGRKMKKKKDNIITRVCFIIYRLRRCKKEASNQQDKQPDGKND